MARNNKAKNLVPSVDLSQLDQAEAIKYRLAANRVRNEVERLRGVTRDLNCHVDGVPSNNMDFDAVLELVGDAQQAVKELALVTQRALKERQKLIGR